MSTWFLAVFFFFNDTATTEIYTLSLHDALPISSSACTRCGDASSPTRCSRSSTGRDPWNYAGSCSGRRRPSPPAGRRSEEHTSELQSLAYLVCRLLLEKKKKYRRLPSAAQRRLT